MSTPDHTRELSLPRQLRPAIASSWLRTDLAGLDPATQLDHLATVDVDRETPLLAAAVPVLDELDERLRDTQFCTMLVDRDCHVVRRWSGDRRVDRRLDDLNIAIGSSLLEEDIGTNALGTAMEIRQSVTVHGDEHFAEVLRMFSCYGQPIRHPLTRRIEGVLDITTLSDQASPLLPPLIARAVADIEQRLLDGSRRSEKQLFDAFQSASALHRRAVLAIGEDLVLSNQAAQDLLGARDVAMLRMLATDSRRLGGVVSMALDDGRPVTVEVTQVAGARRGALLEVEPAGGARSAHRTRAPRSGVRAPLLVCGPPGSGRTTRALELADREPVTLLEGRAALAQGEAAWARTFEDAMQRRTGSVVVDGAVLAAGTVVVDDLDLLPDRLVEVVAAHVDSAERPQLVFTSGPLDTLAGRSARLASVATRREGTLPLAARRAELPAIAARMLAELEPDDHLQLMPSAVAALVAHSWPGNLRELHAVLEHATQRRWGQVIALKDLPDGYRSEVPDRPLAPLDQAQRDVIIATLQRLDGNKVQAARELGLSRTTLYARMKALRITTY